MFSGRAGGGGEGICVRGGCLLDRDRRSRGLHTRAREWRVALRRTLLLPANFYTSSGCGQKAPAVGSSEEGVLDVVDLEPRISKWRVLDLVCTAITRSKFQNTYARTLALHRAAASVLFVPQPRHR